MEKEKAPKVKSCARRKGFSEDGRQDVYLQNGSALILPGSKSKVRISDAIIKRAHEGVCVCHNIPDYPYVRFTVWNDLMTEITGYTMEEINRLGWYQSVYKDPKVQERAIQRMARMRAGDDIICEEWTITRKDGEPRILSISTSVLGKIGKQVHVLAFMRDITEQKKLESELIKARKDWEETFEAIGHPALILSPDYRILQANRTVFKMFHLPKEKLLGKYCYKIFHHSQPPENCPLKKLLQSYHLETIDMELPILHGVYRISCTPVLDEEGNLSRVIHIATDITDRKQAEEALRISEAKYRTLFESAPVGISILDLKGRVLETNNFFLWSPKESIGKNLSELKMIYPEDREKVLKEFKKFLTERLPMTMEVRIFDQENRVRWLEARAVILEGDGKPYTILVISQDITERKHAEEQLLQAQKMEAIGRLAGGVAHDFNNQLLVIQSAAQFLEYSLDQNDPRRMQVELILKAVDQSSALTRQLLAFSHKQEISPRVLNFNQLLENLKKMLGRLIGENIVLELNLAPDLGLVKMDPGQFEQIIFNLAVNSRDAMKKGGKLIFETANVHLETDYRDNNLFLLAGDYVMLSVTDTGKGMSPEVLKHIFEPFFTTKKAGEGTGLGLSIVYGIVKQYGGGIRVESKPGKGTTFWIYFPRTKEAEEKLQIPRSSVSFPRGSETILLVEDNELVRKSLASVLSAYGYQVLEAETGKRALQLFKSQADKIHLLITDMVMEGMSGNELAKKLVQKKPNLKIVLISGYHTTRIPKKRIPQSQMVYLPKPFSNQSLLEKIRKLMD